MSRIVRVSLWGTTVGYLGYAPGQQEFATFEYDPHFMRSGIQIAPLEMDYPPSRYTFDELSYRSFHGVPGCIADSLPDSFGNRLIDIYMAEQGIPSDRITALDRLLYVANRGMGALEYHPGESLPLQRTVLNIHKLAQLSELVAHSQNELHEDLMSATDRAVAISMIRVGSSAGGARSKALVACSPQDKLLDGTVSHGPDYSYWVLKFDSVGNRDRDGRDPRGMPTVEYIYSRIARNAGIDIPRIRLLSLQGESHFMIERFDRMLRDGKLDKRHYLSWAGMAHADRDQPHSYEELVLVMRQLGLGQDAITELFRRAVFNVIGRNQDDHTKNFGFLMDRSGTWRLSPAFDLTYAYDPQGRWTRDHQSWLNRKNNDFSYADLHAFGQFCNLSSREVREIVTRTRDAFGDFPALATEFDLPVKLRQVIQRAQRMDIIPAGHTEG